MTREQQRELKAQKQAKKIADREALKQDKREARAWDKAVERWKAKGAWIDTVVDCNSIGKPHQFNNEKCTICGKKLIF